MRKVKWILVGVILAVLVGKGYFLHAQQKSEKECFFLSSLHYTAQGMKYWYDKESGGAEKITGIPYDDLTCKNCHTASCDVCHKAEKEGKFSYSTEQAKNQEMCLNCHGRQKTMIFKIDKPRDEMDVHFTMGMECLDCHTAGEMHGDGTAYPSMLEPEAMEVKCENCHSEVTPSVSHKVHGNKLDCSACHTRRVVTCYNCHFDTQVKEGKKVAIPTTDWVFLINRNDKVTTGNFQSLVYQGKTFVAFAPFFSHSVMKEGRKCSECHGTEIVKKMKKKKLKLTWYKKGELQSRKGVIPILDGKLDLLFLDRKDGEWIPIKDAPAPLVQYTDYGTPLSDEQFKKLLKKKGK
ncbi:MAG: hypothetical protein KAW16_02925 [candidate division Zixibacteria bacterium]|nr:hypothetical protein [candidate division Zixibacteria bacterium]MCK4427417.1 hypothetical protein [candidate division Zixibacteria bacterium]